MKNKYVVGIDIGTGTVKVVVGSLAPNENGDFVGVAPTIIGVGVQPNLGMRKGVIVDINKVCEAVDQALADAEKMSGIHVDAATVSINGMNIAGMSSRGVIAVNSNNGVITQDEINRVLEAATIVKLAPNRVILNTEARTFKVDNQDGIRDPIDMSGVRLEVDAYVITALMPQLRNIEQVLAQLELTPHKPYVPSGLAAARIALSDQQRENGALLVEIGHSTTTMVVYEEGDIIDIKVFPVGSNNITTDLAVGLKTDLDIAEQVKVQHAVAAPELRRGNESVVAVKVMTPGGEPKRIGFKAEVVDTIVEARLEELFELINKELKRIKKAANLPGGLVLTGGGANLRGIADYAKRALQMNARVYKPQGYKDVSKRIASPSFVTAVGLMEIDADSAVLNVIEEEPQRSGFFGKLKGMFVKK